LATAAATVRNSDSERWNFSNSALRRGLNFCADSRFLTPDLKDSSISAADFLASAESGA
jgi:hypothetical protein